MVFAAKNFLEQRFVQVTLVLVLYLHWKFRMFVVNNFYEPDMFLFSKDILCTFLMVDIVLVLKFTERLLVPVYILQF